MKRYLHFYCWLAAVVMMMFSMVTMSAQTKLTDLRQLKSGTVIRIYPQGYKVSYYGEAGKALACNGDGQPLTSYEKAGSGDFWTVIHSRGGCCYLRNENGCYWAYQDGNSTEQLTCTTNVNLAVEVNLTYHSDWVSNTYGVCFWNHKDGKGLTNSNEDWTYGWRSNRGRYDTSAIYDVDIVKEGDGVVIADEGEKKVTNPYAGLKVGDVIKIYPIGNDGKSHFEEENLALACSGDGQPLTSYEKAGSGDVWILMDAGGGNYDYYLKNIYGCYWTAQEKSSSSSSLTCATSENSAVKVTITGGSTIGCIRFINEKDKNALTTLNEDNSLFNWWALMYDHTKANYEAKLLDGIEFTDNGINYLLDAHDNTAKVLSGNYKGDIIVPQTISCVGMTFTVTSLSKFCFSKRPVNSVTLPNTITVLSDSCFYDCASLTNVTLPNSITSIGDGCFAYCTELSQIDIPDGVVAIGDNCFYHCESLSCIVLPNSVSRLGDGCFDWCNNLASVTLSNSITSLGYRCFNDCMKLTSITLPNSLTSLGEKCFFNCGLKSIVLPDGITDIGKDCFACCYFMKSVTLPKNIRSLSEDCFNACRYLAEIVVPEKVKSIGDRCFIGCTLLKSVKLPRYLESLGKYCFAYCSKLTDINLSENRRLPSLSVSCFEGCSSLKSISLSGSVVTSIEDSCFKDCNHLESIDITRTCLNTLGDKCFYGCSYLENIAFPDYIMTSIGDECFYGCNSLASIMLPKLKSIGNNVFYNTGYGYDDNNVKKRLKIFCRDTTPPIGLDSSDKVCMQSYYLFVPKEAVDDYKNAVPWNNAKGIFGGEPVTSVNLPSEITVVHTESQQIEAMVQPEIASVDQLEWESVESSVASVDESGFVTGNKVGTTTILARVMYNPEILASCTVRVMPLLVSDFISNTTSVVKNVPTPMDMLFTPIEADTQTLKWTSLTPEIAAVTENGIVTGLMLGTAQLKAETTDGSNISKTFDVQVTENTTSNVSLHVEISGDVEMVVNKRHLFIKGLSEQDSIQVVNAMGVTVYRGVEHEVELSAPGIYMVKAKGKTMKICVK